MTKKKTKKYFMQGTADELEFGDQIALDLTKDMPNGKVQHHHLDCKFVPELVDMLLEDGIIEEHDVGDEGNGLEKPLDEGCPMMDELIKANQNLEHRVYDLEKEIDKLKAIVMNLKPGKNARKSA